MQYSPKPMQTDDIILSKELTAVIEEISMNIHEVWAVGRMNQGWQYGEKYSTDQKMHPSLVPYTELPESEKEFDRNTVTQTIKCLLKKGFEIKE